MCCKHNRSKRDITVYEQHERKYLYLTITVILLLLLIFIGVIFLLFILLFAVGLFLPRFFPIIRDVLYNTDRIAMTFGPKTRT